LVGESKAAVIVQHVGMDVHRQLCLHADLVLQQVDALAVQGLALLNQEERVGRHYGGAFAAHWSSWLHGGSLQRGQRLELEIDPDLRERIEELSIRSGRSIPEIIQGLISCSFPIYPVETVLGESIS
jgi:hypothetical protein